MSCAPRGWHEDLGRPEERVREATYASRVIRALASLGRVDLIHDHGGYATLVTLAASSRVPLLHTVHGSLREIDRTFYREVGDRVALVAISGSQRRSAATLPWVATVHNAVDTASLEMGTRTDKAGYLLCLARICADKGQHIAIEIARRVGMRLVLAGKVAPTDTRYYDNAIAPAVDGRRVIHLDNVGGADKARLLSRASALLAPIQWEEPFGLSLIEAMASGTPVIATPRGAVPELVDDGVTGLLAGDVDGLVAAVRHVDDIDPNTCAAIARDRFGPETMAARYLAVYEHLLNREEPRVA